MLRMNSPRAKQAERALRVFLLHYYSADWIRNILLELRFKTALHEKSKLTTESFQTLMEDALLLCLKASIKLFPTARGLKEIDDIVANTSLPVALMSGSSGKEYRFAIFNKHFCIDTRYRMSLLTLANNAREGGNDSLASLWVIAATAKLNHVSAWQAYAAAKEEESRLLNYAMPMKYWQSEKSYAGDVKEKEFDKMIFNMYHQREVEEKEAEFRRFLHSKVDPSLQSTADTYDLIGDAFLRIYCNVKANSPSKHCSNRLWMLANDLYGKQEFSFIQTKKVISIAFQLEDILERLRSAAKNCRLNFSYNLPFASVWMKASRFLEDIILKLRLLIDDQEVNVTESNDPKLEHLIERMSMLIKRLNDCLSYAPTMRTMKHFDSILQQVLDALPFLTSHPEHSFPDLRTLLTTYCKEFTTTNEQYMDVLEEIMRHYIQMMDPPVELLKQFEQIEDERSCNVTLFQDHQLFLNKLQALLERSPPLFDRLKDEIYVKVLHSFADSYYTVNINDYYEYGSWKSISVRKSFFRRFDELFSFAVEASTNNMDSSSVSLELLDISFDSIKYSKTPEWKNFKLLELSDNAKGCLKQALSHGMPDSKRLELLEAGKKFREASALFMKGEELRRNSNQEQGMRQLANLYFNAAKCTEEVANYIPTACSKSTVTYRLKAMKYMEAINAFEGGDEKMALEYEQQAFQIT